MRKHLFSFVAEFLCYGLVYSQVDVFADGKVVVNGTLSTSTTGLSMGDRSYISDYNVHTSSLNPVVGCYGIAEEGTVIHNRRY